MDDPATAKAALQYGTTQGHPPLRRKILGLLNRLDGTEGNTATTPDHVVVTTGSQQLLYLLGEILFDAGDIVVTEAPSYFVYHAVLASRGVRVETVPMDDGGMCIDGLARLLERLDAAGELAKVKLIYTVDYFQNPTGLSLAAGSPSAAFRPRSRLRREAPHPDIRGRRLPRVAVRGAEGAEPQEPRHAQRILCVTLAHSRSRVRPASRRVMPCCRSRWSIRWCG